MADATVTVLSIPNGERVAQIRSDVRGRYSLALTGGQYVVVATAPGFEVQSKAVALHSSSNDVVANLALPQGTSDYCAIPKRL